MDIGSAWANYVKRLGKLDDEATKKVGEYIGSIPDFSFTNPEDMNKLVAYAYGISTKYGEGAAALACEMYDAIGIASGQILPPAEPADIPNIDEVAKAVRGTAKTGNVNTVSGAVGRLVKRTGADTTLNNAIRDGAYFAWIPHGDTCAFCITLASRGWQKASPKALKNGHAEHIHANCDCTYAVQFNGKPSYKNYDPDKYYDMYSSAEGKDSKDKVNSLRRIRYQENKDRINAQKRAAYAERQTLSMKRNASTIWSGEPRQNTNEQIEELRKYASEKNIILDASFKSFDGDISLVRDFVDKMDENINATSHARKKIPHLGVSYSMDDDVYAETKNASVTINGFAYRDRDALAKDYLKKVQEKWFTEDSTYKDIATHESAHVMIYLNQAKQRGIIEVIFGNNEIEASDYIAENISKYALANDDELIAESYVRHSNGSKDEIVLKILQYCGIL